MLPCYLNIKNYRDADPLYVLLANDFYPQYQYFELDKITGAGFYRREHWLPAVKSSPKPLARRVVQKSLWR